MIVYSRGERTDCNSGNVGSNPSTISTPFVEKAKTIDVKNAAAGLKTNG